MTVSSAERMMGLWKITLRTTLGTRLESFTLDAQGHFNVERSGQHDHVLKTMIGQIGHGTNADPNSADASCGRFDGEGDNGIHVELASRRRCASLALLRLASNDRSSERASIRSGREPRSKLGRGFLHDDSADQPGTGHEAMKRPPAVDPRVSSTRGSLPVRRARARHRSDPADRQGRRRVP